MKWVLVFTGLCMFGMPGFSQNKDMYRYEVELGTDNDFLILYTATDRYYTYGLNGTFKWRSNKEDKQGFLGRLFPNTTSYYESLGISIEAYTPNYLPDGSPDPNDDRPYSGWSYIDYKITYELQGAFIQLGADVGIMGPDSKAGDVQNWFHRTISNDPELSGWEDQLPNQIGINIRAAAGNSFLSAPWFDAFYTIDASIGNILIYAQPKIGLRFGKFDLLSKSISQNHQLLGTTKKVEYFFELGGGFRFSAYNATLQGNIFENSSLLSQEEINNAIFHSQMAINLLYKRFSAKVVYHLSTGELSSVDTHRYAELKVGYRFN